ncbi:hypothetical protein ACQ4PT_016042 [Festuca glaucescens]
MEDWSKVYDAIGFGNDYNEAVQNARKIISFSYYDLPSCRKTCLIYMSIFAEDSWIEKNSLIWKWVAEGFITDKEGIGLFEQGENCFNDLVNRSMIRWVDPGRDSSRGGCSVHDMVLDLILNLSGELNFARILDENQEIRSSSSSCKSNNLVRRLSIHNRCAEQYTAIMELGHLRSFSATSCSDGRMPPLRSFKALRVLALDRCGSSASDWCLDHIGKLLHLRYLGLTRTPFTELPRDIGHYLKFLKTLDVRESGIRELPVSVGELRKLACLCASEGTKMMASIRKLTSLEELQLVHVDVSPNFTRELRNLTQLRLLHIAFDEMDESTHKDLVESVCNLRRLQSLGIGSDWGKSTTRELNFDHWEGWVPPLELHTLCHHISHLPRRPRWMNYSVVPHISYLAFCVDLMKQQDMQILGRFPSLRYLMVSTRRYVLYTVGTDEFRKLRGLFTNMEIICGGEGGALMMLEELSCMVLKNQGVGILVPGSMPLLHKTTFELDCEGCSAVQSDDVKNDDKSMELPAGEEEVRAEDLQDYLSSTFSSVLNSPVIHDLLFKLGHQSGLEFSLDTWRYATKSCQEECMNHVLDVAQDVHGSGQSDSSDDLSGMMQQMLPVVSQILAGLPPFESTLKPQHNDDGNFGGELDTSLQVIVPSLILFHFDF